MRPKRRGLALRGSLHSHLRAEDVPLFQYRRKEFLRHCHKRSVESVFSMIKAKFREHVRSKTDAAMVNEILCKIICRNILCLIHESHELGIETAFWEAA